MAAHAVDTARDRYGVDGSGLGIGVLSDGVDTLVAQQASGDLPPHVTVLPGQRGSGDEGTAMLEIVHDLAPGAHLYFANATEGGQAQFAANIEALCAAGADIIVDDVIYFVEAAFQDGIVAQGINTATEDGCYHVSAAGNNGNLNDETSGVWEGDYVAGSPLTVEDEPVGVTHVFGGGSESNGIVEGGEYVVLQWADPLGASANDYDLFLVDGAGAVLASSTSTQDGTQDPVEFIAIPPGAADGRLVIVKASGEDRYMRLELISGRLETATAGAIGGHNAAEAALAIGAVDVGAAGGPGGVFNGSEPVETFSSDGPRKLFFDRDGAAITPGDFSASGGRELHKPDVTAANRVTTSTPGYHEFPGTSAAAPHAAAIAALMVEAAGGPSDVTTEDIRAAMAVSALDIEAPGADRDSGAGIVMAPAAVAALLADPRNRAPMVVERLPDMTFDVGGEPDTIDLSGAFTDPDGDTLRYSVLSSDPARLGAAAADGVLTITPLGPGHLTVTVRAADPGGLAAVQGVSVRVAAGDRDYDLDDDGLIEVGALRQLDAMRYDLDGDGEVDGDEWRPYYEAFAEGALDMGCPETCRGYELTANLDLDTNGNGRADEDDAYWNDGAGWSPIGVYADSGWFGYAGDAFRATFEGNGHRIANLFIDRPRQGGVGLFGYVGRAGATTEIRSVDLTGVDVTGDELVGALVGQGFNCWTLRSAARGRVSGRAIVGGLVGQCRVRDSHAAVRVTATENAAGGLAAVAAGVENSFATGAVSGYMAVGGLVGFLSRGRIAASYATGSVSGEGLRLEFLGHFVCGPIGGVGGLLGNQCGEIEHSYATGPVTGTLVTGGLVGTGHRPIRRSYWDVQTSGVHIGVGSDDADDDGSIGGDESVTAGATGLATASLQEATRYDGIYTGWDTLVSNEGRLPGTWRLRGPSDYPALAADRDGDGEPTWEEFGYQLRSGPDLAAASARDESRVTLSWPAADTSPWPRPPRVTYSVTRWNGEGSGTVTEGIEGTEFVDETVEIDGRYAYQVASVIGAGEPARSARVAVRTGTANRPPRPVGVLPDRTLRVGAPALHIEGSAAFEDPDGDDLSYEASSSSPEVASVQLSGSSLAVTAVATGSTTVLLTATDRGGSDTSATQRFVLTTWGADAIDYDLDDDGLIDIASLAQLDAMRHDRDGDGTIGTTVFGPSGDASAYEAAFPAAAPGMGCSFARGGCAGYELVRDLDFDTNGNGAADPGDAYWNAGAGWEPIGGAGSSVSDGVSIYRNAFNTTFDGNGHTVANLFIRREDAPATGLFGATLGTVRNVGLVGADVHGGYNVGILAGYNNGTVIGSHASGQVSGTRFRIGGLVGSNSEEILRSYSSALVSGKGDAARMVGGLAGQNFFGTIAASYATGRVAGQYPVGGLVGYSTGESGRDWVIASYSIAQVAPEPPGRGLIASGSPEGVLVSYWDAETSGHTGAGGRTTAELQGPTGYTGLYRQWNVDLDGDGRGDDPWHFGTRSQYPALSLDVNGDGRATWQEFGHQLRRGPRLTLTPARDIAQVELTWTAADTGHWQPPPLARYTVLRRQDAVSDPIAMDLNELTFLDREVDPGGTYHYQVAVAIGGGEATRSAEVTTTIPGTAIRPPRPVSEPPDRTLRPGERLVVDVDDLFEDPERRTLVYSVAVSRPSVVSAGVDGGAVTLEGSVPGTATVTVTATNTDGATAEQTFVVEVRGTFLVPFFPAASDEALQGFVRVTNHADEGGEVRIEPIDDTGTRYEPLTLTVGAHETAPFNSSHLERGGADRGLSGATGPGAGDWRLVIDAALDIEVLSYLRTVDGFLTSMHDVAPGTETRHQVVFLNPGSNAAQVSTLRLINPADTSAEATVRGIDDSGASPGEAVVLTVPGGAATTYTAAELEMPQGGHAGLGDGMGKWRLAIESDAPLQAMSLLRSPTLHLTNLSTAPVQADIHHVPLFPPASDAQGRQGFVRIVNRAGTDGEVRIVAFDDTGRTYDPVTASIRAHQTLPFNSDDLEGGNLDKGLSGSTGPGEGDWRLEVSSDLDIAVYSYIRTADGFLTSMHDVVPFEGGQHWVAIFNPGSNDQQASRLRVVNPGSRAARVTVQSMDDRGSPSVGAVTFPVPAGRVRAFTAAEFEAGGAGFDGALGDGIGKWRLAVSSDEPVLVMSLLESPTGHLTNLSTARVREGR